MIYIVYSAAVWAALNIHKRYYNFGGGGIVLGFLFVIFWIQWNLKQWNGEAEVVFMQTMWTTLWHNDITTLTVRFYLFWLPGPGSFHRCRVPRRSRKTPRTQQDSWYGRAGWCSGGYPDTDHCPLVAMLWRHRRDQWHSVGIILCGEKPFHYNKM